MDQLENFKSCDGFHFKLCYPELIGVNEGDGCNEWIQTSNPATESTITGFKPISLSFSNNSYLNSWAGIGKDISGRNSTFIDDVPNEKYWFTAIGSYSYYPSTQTTIPGPRNQTDLNLNTFGVHQVELYVKTGRYSTNEFELFQGPHFEFLQQYKAEMDWIPTGFPPEVVGLTFYQAFMNGP